MGNLDALGRKILHEVQLNNQLTSAQLSEKIGLSPSSAQRRLNRLRTENVIEGDISVVSCAALMSAYYVTGDNDFILIVSAKDMEEYEAFTRKFLYDNPDVKGFKTTVVMDRIKASFYIPLWE